MVSSLCRAGVETRETVPLEDLDADALRQIVAKCGLDEATRLLFQSVCDSPIHGDAIRQIEALRDEGCSNGVGPLVVVVPGFLYREYPRSGADGRVIVEAAEQLGWDHDVVPIESTGRLATNAKRLLRWLDEHQERPVVLASISKGGSEVAAALQADATGRSFSNVLGWVDVGGIVRGSPVVDFVARQRLRMMAFRILFALRRWTFASVMDLSHKHGSLAQGFRAPPHMRIVHAVGFPQEDDFTLSKLRNFYRLIGELGPNDGAILLHDTLATPGVVYPVRGADHYMRPRFRVQPLCRGLLRYAAGHLPSKETT